MAWPENDSNAEPDKLTDALALGLGVPDAEKDTRNGVSETTADIECKPEVEMTADRVATLVAEASPVKELPVVAEWQKLAKLEADALVVVDCELLAVLLMDGGGVVVTSAVPVGGTLPDSSVLIVAEEE